MTDVSDINSIIERHACISGVGQSEIGRRLFRDPLELTLDGCLAAGTNAGAAAATRAGFLVQATAPRGAGGWQGPVRPVWLPPLWTIRLAVCPPSSPS